MPLFHATRSLHLPGDHVRLARCGGRLVRHSFAPPPHPSASGSNSSLSPTPTAYLSALLYMSTPFGLDYLWASHCLPEAVFFNFRTA